MRSLLIAASILIAVVLCACIIEIPVEKTETSCPARASKPTMLVIEPRDDWRRTIDGWERSATWRKPHNCGFPSTVDFGRVHPATIAALQTLLSFGALLAFSDVTLIQKHPKPPQSD